jgi:hypothetical protein
MAAWLVRVFLACNTDVETVLWRLLLSTKE